MVGTKAGGQKAAATNKERHGKDFYREIGRKGGKNGTGHVGFAVLKERNPKLFKEISARNSRSQKGTRDGK